MSGKYEIVAAGGGGGSATPGPYNFSTFSGGLGAVVTTRAYLTAGVPVYIAVGGVGDNCTLSGCGGGGATAVYTNCSNPLVIAGGGAGASPTSYIYNSNREIVFSAYGINGVDAATALSTTGLTDGATDAIPAYSYRGGYMQQINYVPATPSVNTSGSQGFATSCGQWFTQPPGAYGGGGVGGYYKYNEFMIPLGAGGGGAGGGDGTWINIGVSGPASIIVGYCGTSAAVCANGGTSFAAVPASATVRFSRARR